jgi:hypothetical protein
MYAYSCSNSALGDEVTNSFELHLRGRVNILFVKKGGASIKVLYNVSAASLRSWSKTSTSFEPNFVKTRQANHIAHVAKLPTFSILGRFIIDDFMRKSFAASVI